MKVFFLTTLVFVSSFAAPASARTAREEIATRQFLLGTWHCTFTVGEIAGTYTTVWAKTLDDMWLTQSIVQPAPPAPGFRSNYFIGYDERHQGWVRFGAMTTGQYFAIRMRDLDNGGWAWKYVSFFPLRKPLRSGDDARFLRVTDKKYTIDGPTYPGPSGTNVTEHHICTKAP